MRFLQLIKSDCNNHLHSDTYEVKDVNGFNTTTKMFV